jgi:hypothetical protein
MFDLSRFRRLARAHFAEQWRHYAWFMAVILLVEILVSILYAVGKGGFAQFGTQAQEGYFYVGLFTFAPIFAGRYFLNMSTRASALLSLMRPATVLEKWLLAFLIVAVLYPLAYLLAYYLVVIPDNFLAYAQAKQQAAQAALDYAKSPVGSKPAAFHPEHYQLFLPWAQPWRDQLSMVLWLLFLQGFAMFGSLYFRTVPFIKTLLSGLLIFLVSALLASMLAGIPELVTN